MKLPRRFGRSAFVVVAAAVVTAGLVAGVPSAQAVPAPHPPAGAGPQTPQPTSGSEIPPGQRADALPPRWQVSGDEAWTAVGDTAGFHLMVAEERTGYAWRTVASLTEPGVETDRWIGNVCFTESGRWAVVVYAPRSFTNEGDLFLRGGFTAVVDTATGALTKVGLRSSLAYYNPGCGIGDRAVITQAREGDARTGAATRLFDLDATTGAVRPVTEVAGQLTSAVPVAGGGVVAAAGRNLVSVGPKGLRPLAGASSVPFRITPDADGGVVFTEHADGVAHIRRLTSVRGAARVTELAHGQPAAVRVAPSTHGRVFVTGAATVTGALPASVRQVDAPSGAQVSTEGHLALLSEPRPSLGTGDTSARTPSPQWTDAMTLPGVDDPDEPSPVTFTARIIPTHKEVEFTVTPGTRSAPEIADGARPHPLNEAATTGSVGVRLSGAGSTAGADGGVSPNGSAGSTVDPEESCAVPRNDPRSQVYQPTPRQVEWAADQAVTGDLTMLRPANWKESGLPSYSPQGLFPSIPLDGGGRVPAQVLLGIMSQESNLWQASGHALSGTPGNPLVGNFYGRDVTGSDPLKGEWDIDFADADCGYGVTQITDGMRKQGHARPGEVLLDPVRQRAAGLDYAANIAAGLRILQTKWNETRQAGIIHADGDPANLENWIFAIWAYNSGLHPDTGSGPWGLGWANNPANPNYPADRTFFNLDPHDPAHPQDWPYEEKVIGFAAFSIATVDGPGFRPSWWVSEAARMAAKPPIFAFCSDVNDCVPGGQFTPNDPAVAGEPVGPCGHRNSSGLFDLQCWWHLPATYNNCGSGFCGNELHRFDNTFPEQPDGTHSEPHCGLSGLPAGARVIDDVPDSVPSVRRKNDGSVCTDLIANSGTFSLNFGADAQGRFASKIDFHQIGGGYNGHFWFAHTRQPGADGGKFRVTGTWTFNQSFDQWGRVLIHMPDIGAHTQQARYDISLGNGVVKQRYALQRTEAHRWVSLGVFRLAGTPSISLSNETWDGAARDDVAFDAVAIEPLAAKPRDFVVALGDSYSSGEGASDPDGGDDYYRETDNNGDLDDDKGRNACHRSPFAWSRRAVLADNSGQTIGARADGWDDTLDYQLHACSGAQTENILPFHSVAAAQRPSNAFGQQGSGQFGEVSQIDKGYLDENTTLVTMSVGGNDARFSDIIKECVYAAGLFACPDAQLSGEDEHLSVTVPRDINGRVKDSILITLQEVHRRAPNAKIVLMGYPQLLENDGQCVIGIGTAEAPWLRDMGSLMAQMMGDVADTATAQQIPTWFSDPIDEFAGKGICGDPESIHGIVTDTTDGDKPQFLGLLPPSSQSFHPKIAGTALYAASLNQTLRTMGL